MISIHAESSVPSNAPPAQWHDRLRDGTHVLIRQIRGDDALLERAFIEGLSPAARRFRFLGEVKMPNAALIEQLTHPDPERDVAFVALVADGAEKREIGVARFCTRPDGRSCECAVVVADAWQQHGLATLLMQHLIDVARARGIECMYSVDAVENQAMRELAAHLGFRRKPDPDDTTQVLHTLDLRAPSAG